MDLTSSKNPLCMPLRNCPSGKKTPIEECMCGGWGVVTSQTCAQPGQRKRRGKDESGPVLLWVSEVMGDLGITPFSSACS